jgi:glucokinase
MMPDGTRLLTRRLPTDPHDGADAVMGRVLGAAHALAVHVANLAVALDPDRIVFGGGFLPHTGDLVDRVWAVVSRATPFPPEVGTAALVEDAALLGALLLASDAAAA